MANVESCDQLCRKHRYYFVIGIAPSVFVFILFHFLTIPTKFAEKLADSDVFWLITTIDILMIPRSYGELDALRNNIGDTYYIWSVIFETSLAICGFIGILCEVIALFSYNQDLLPTGWKRIYISIFFILLSLFIRPATFVYQSMVYNYIDRYGLYFIKEGILIMAAYYHAGLVIINIINAIQYRFR